jgi:hypothetical protein
MPAAGAAAAAEMAVPADGSLRFNKTGTAKQPQIKRMKGKIQ